MLDGRDKLEMWWVEEGYLTELSSVLMVNAPLMTTSIDLCLALKSQMSTPVPLSLSLQPIAGSISAQPHCA